MGSNPGQPEKNVIANQLLSRWQAAMSDLGRAMSSAKNLIDYMNNVATNEVILKIHADDNDPQAAVNRCTLAKTKITSAAIPVKEAYESLKPE